MTKIIRYSYGKEFVTNSTSYLNPYIKVNLKWITDLI